MVAPMVTKLELEGLATEGLTQQLVTHAYAKHGLLAQQLLHSLYCIWHRRWVPLQQHSTFTQDVRPSSYGVQQPLLTA